MLQKSICIMIGVCGSYIAGLFGGWNAAMSTLLIFMAVDYISGILVAGIFHASSKSKNGSLESRAGFKGLCRKGMILFVVLVAARLGKLVGSDFIRDAVIIAYISNETISIMENAGLMGIPIPKQITSAIDILKNRGEKNDPS